MEDWHLHTYTILFRKITKRYVLLLKKPASSESRLEFVTRKKR